MREYGVTACSEECGLTVWRSSYWLVKDDAGSGGVCYGSSFHCPKCGTRVGIDERGPWREQMVPRAALEWLAGISEGCAQVSPCPAAKLLSDANREAACRECLVQAALKAAEEATQSE
jgi:hypothetical protein